MKCEKRWVLWKVKNGWLAVSDRSAVPDGFEGRGYAMQDCSVHASLRSFADFLNQNNERKDKSK